MNSVGESARSLERSALPATTAGAPTLTSATAGDGKIDLAWTAPSNGGSAITGYRIYRGTTSGSETLLTNAGGSTTTYTDTSATNGTTYYYEVSAVNAVGKAFRERAVCDSGRVQRRPDRTHAHVCDARQQRDAGLERTRLHRWLADHRVQHLPRNHERRRDLLLAVGNVTTYTDETTTDGTTYYYQVSAVNASGESARSIERSATPHASDTTPPSTPSGLKVLLTGTTQIAHWLESVDGQYGVTAYQIFRNGSLVGPSACPGTSPPASHPVRTTVPGPRLGRRGNQSPGSTSLSARPPPSDGARAGTVSGVAYTQAGAQLSSGTVTLTSAGGAVKPAKWSKGVGRFRVRRHVHRDDQRDGVPDQTSVTTVLGGQKSLVLTTL